MSLWSVLVLAGLGSLALRLSFLVLPERLRLPAAWERLADLVYPAAMAAILGGALHGLVAAGDARHVAVLAPAALATALVSRLTGSVLGALGAGLAVVFALNLMF